MSSAFKIGFILCIVGLVTITAGLFLVPLVTDRVCDQQRARGQRTKLPSSWRRMHEGANYWLSCPPISSGNIIAFGGTFYSYYGWHQ
jgi:hypothetical protein